MHPSRPQPSRRSRRSSPVRVILIAAGLLVPLAVAAIVGAGFIRDRALDRAANRETQNDGKALECDPRALVLAFTSNEIKANAVPK